MEPEKPPVKAPVDAADTADGGPAHRRTAASAHTGSDGGTASLAALLDRVDLDLTDPAQRRFGGYELVEMLDRGGNGVVYRARQLALGREVAIKLLAAGPWATGELMERFRREASVVARLEHANIITVFELGCCDGIPWYSMRLVRGTSLGSRLRHGERFTATAAAAMIRTVALAIHYAHGLGVLHLDLTPGNILVDARGVPYLTDFGMARQVEGALAVENVEVAGTPAYMAPEQTRVGAHGVSAATDVWAMGVALYLMVTGQQPFRGRNVAETLDLVQFGTVRPPERFAPSVGCGLGHVIARCLLKDPGQRYPTAAALADDLGRIVAGHCPQACPRNALQHALDRVGGCRLVRSL